MQPPGQLWEREGRPESCCLSMWPQEGDGVSLGYICSSKFAPSGSELGVMMGLGETFRKGPLELGCFQGTCDSQRQDYSCQAEAGLHDG